jgi:ATP-dependent DNA helicase Q4
LGVNVILGLTATAPDATLSDCATRLGVNPESGIVRGPFMPDNLTLTVSKDKNRENALLELLKMEPFASFDSIIIYCTRLEFFEILASQ